MTAVARRAEPRLSASSVTSNSIRLSFAGYDVGWMTKTSSPRTFSWISTNTSISEKRRTLASVSGMCRYAEIASASGRLALQARIFMSVSPSAAVRPDGPPQARRNVTKGFRCRNDFDRPRAGKKSRQARALRVPGGGQPDLFDEPADAGRGGAGDGIGDVAPGAVEAAGGDRVLLLDPADFAAVRPQQHPGHLDLLLLSVGRRDLDRAGDDEVLLVGRRCGEGQIRARQCRTHRAGQRAVAITRRASDPA